MIQWRIVDDYEALGREAATLFLDRIELDPATALLLPTGSTPEGMYREVVQACSTRYRCFRDVTTFNLDEYAGVSADHPGSYHAYMEQRLFRWVDLDPERIHLLDGLASLVRQEHPAMPLDEALEAECAIYEREIHAARGVDLAFLGLGRNGHIGFNEPGSPFDSRTRVVTLDESTRAANAPFFPDGHVPRRALTVGIATILDSASIVLMASGASKAPAIARLAAGERDIEFPASALLSHPDVLAIVDRAAWAQAAME